MAPPHQNSLEDARRLLANCILIRGLQENGASDAPRNDAMFRTWLFVGIHSECAGQYSDANGSVPAQSKLALRLISGRHRSTPGTKRDPRPNARVPAEQD